MYSSLMKKTLRTLFIVILLIGVGSLYVVKFPDSVVSQKILNAIGGQVVTDATVSTGIDLTNCSSYFDGCNTCFVQSWVVGGCTRMYCATPTEPKCLQYTTGTREQGQGTSDQGPGLDLTNCVSYFDGCNNCTVKDGKPEACTLMYCETPTEPKCNQYTTGTRDQGSGTSTPTVGIANPASVNCQRNGGTLALVTSSDGGQVGMCTLSDGTVCEERAYMRGECKAGTGDQGAGASPGNAWAWAICTMEYAPVCASIQVQCVKAPCPPIQQTFGNKCQMNANKLANFLHDGECNK